MTIDDGKAASADVASVASRGPDSPERERHAAVFWFLLLLSMLPAIRADLLFPHRWLSELNESSALPPIDNPFGWLAPFLAIAVLRVAPASTRRLRTAAAAAFVLVFVADSGIGGYLAGLNNAYALVALGAFVGFARYGSALSLPFASFLLLLVTLGQIDDLLAWPQIVVFLVAALVARLVVETWQQNLPLARQLGRSNVVALTRQSLSLWWPMLILIAAGLWFSQLLSSGAEATLYSRNIVTPYCSVDVVGPEAILECPNDELTVVRRQLRVMPAPDVPDHVPQCVVWDGFAVEVPDEPMPAAFECPPLSDQTDSWALSRLPFFDSVDLSIERRYYVREWRLRRELELLRRTTKATADGARSEAYTLYEAVPEETGMSPSECEFLELTCGAANIVISELNRAYVAARADGREEFADYMERKAREANGEVDVYMTAAEKQMTAILARFEERTRAAVDRVENASQLVRQLLLLWLVVAAIKSFLYVFSRVIFDKATDIDVDLLERSEAPAEGSVRHLQEITIPGDYQYDLFYKSNYQPLGPAARFSLPQWHRSILSRLRHGAWHMSRVDMPLAEPTGVTFNAIEAEHLVDWTLVPGEEVVFSYNNFVAMNERVELRTVISLRVATLLLGRIVFHTARCTGGQGRLILRTRGKPATAEQVRQSIPAARLIAWNRYARFSVDSHLTPVDIFLNGFNLRRSAGDDDGSPQGILVVEADARDGGLLVGTLRFARNFLLPI